mmetsp:Transcript_16195/g.27139  ORF Transcript_16195/g.27139 Transcript_16195/m.27139 type:complete len:418 (+) Transcript_16195:273-1526(+)
MIAGAKHISPSAVGFVYTANVLPSFLVKLTGPYWFHRVPYQTRIYTAAALMACSFFFVSLGQIMDNNLAVQLFGIVLGSVQSGFGEASFLALAAFFPSRLALTAWSSGTGFAGIFGYSWVIIFTVFIGTSFQLATLCALVLPLCFVFNYKMMITDPHIARDRILSSEGARAKSLSSDPDCDLSKLKTLSSDSDSSDSSTSNNDVELLLRSPSSAGSGSPSSGEDTTLQGVQAGDLSLAASRMTTRQRMRATLELWPFMVPLFVVYFAEYAMQSGVWAAIGFPVDSENARDLFYEYSNWMYQAGVLVSRSSGVLWQADLRALWTMPALQVAFLVFFLLNAYYMFWYSWSLLALCFCVGLLGGAVYVNGFALISEKVPPHLKEFSLSAASIADSIGIACANIAGIFIQKALYDYHDLSD